VHIFQLLVFNGLGTSLTSDHIWPKALLSDFTSELQSCIWQFLWLNCLSSMMIVLNYLW